VADQDVGSAAIVLGSEFDPDVVLGGFLDSTKSLRALEKTPPLVVISVMVTGIMAELLKGGDVTRPRAVGLLRFGWLRWRAGWLAIFPKTWYHTPMTKFL